MSATETTPPDVECRPPRTGEGQISAEWLTERLHEGKWIPQEVCLQEVVVEDLEGNRGLTGAISRLRLVYPEGTDTSALPQRLIYKTAQDQARAAMIGCGREGQFYAHPFAQSPSLQGLLPRMAYARGDFATGDVVILMEDLSASHEGVHGVNMRFGNQVWGLPSDRTLPDAATQRDTLRTMFLTAARWHAEYWRDERLMEHSWMKTSAWYRGEHRTRWEGLISFGRHGWDACKPRMKEEGSPFAALQWSEKLIGVIDRTFEAATWDALQKRLSDRTLPFTLTHGDFHGSNMLWLPEAEQPLRLIDWTELGPWEPCTDLGQTIISDVRPEVWRGQDEPLLRAYWDELIRLGVSPDDFPWELCVERYHRGPAGRWIWLFGVLCGLQLPTHALQYFHDQLLAFIEAHGDYSVYEI